MAKEGIPFIIVPLLLALIFVYFQTWSLFIVFIALAAFIAFFFRDPERNVPQEPNVIVSAADGRITRIEETEEGKLVSIFLSPLDVHINRAPIGGKITKITYTKGKKIPATSDKASYINERNSLVIENEKLKVTCTQIAGILARRIVCWKNEGDKVEIGERFGLIKFGSRTDILMPPSVEILIQIGDKVRGGETVIARLKDE